MNNVIFSRHAIEQLADRGATQKEIVQAIQEGEKIPAKVGRLAFRKNFPYEKKWKTKYYEIKQVMPIVAKEGDKFVVITIYVFYFGGEGK
ncbi:MAG: DUF4258 domain-containing protein [Candidatus Margulisiibacteriota bacterium]